MIYKEVNILESIKAFILLKEDPADESAFQELAEVEGNWQANVLLDSILEKPGFWYNPVAWHPGQAKWVYLNYPELKEILDEINFSDLEIERFVSQKPPSSKNGDSNDSLVQSIINGNTIEPRSMISWKDFL